MILQTLTGRFRQPVRYVYRVTEQNNRSNCIPSPLQFWGISNSAIKHGFSESYEGSKVFKTICHTAYFDIPEFFQIDPPAPPKKYHFVGAVYYAQKIS